MGIKPKASFYTNADRWRARDIAREVAQQLFGAIRARQRKVAGDHQYRRWAIVGALDRVPDSMAGPYKDYRKAVQDRVQAFGQSRQATKGAQTIGRAADTLAPISNEPTTYDPRKAEFYYSHIATSGWLFGAAGRRIADDWRCGGCAVLAGAAMNAEQTYQETMARTGNEQLAHGKRRILARRLVRWKASAWAGCSISLASSKHWPSVRCKSSKKQARKARRNGSTTSICGCDARLIRTVPFRRWMRKFWAMPCWAQLWAARHRSAGG